jgi:Leucine-rich repeat (LRR) protein
MSQSVKILPLICSDKTRDEKVKLSFAYCNLNNDNDVLNVINRSDNLNSITELDLTENCFNGSTDLRFLVNLPSLETLILDKNQIVSNIVFPTFEHLKTLSLNHNKVENLVIFINNLKATCKNLKYLSMLNNKAAPSYFNGGTLAEYKQYRLFVISKLPKLCMLDDSEITTEERLHSTLIYGKEANVQPKSSRKSRNMSVYKLEQNEDAAILESLPNVVTTD